jgi:hypothetical protein
MDLAQRTGSISDRALAKPSLERRSSCRGYPLDIRMQRPGQGLI